MTMTTNEAEVALASSTEAYFRDGDHAAFDARQRAIWDAMKGKPCEAKVLASIRARLVTTKKR